MQLNTLIKILVTMVALGATSCMSAYPPSRGQSTAQINYNSPPQQGTVSLQVFYDELSPYGNWVSYNNYGFVWIPEAGLDFYPYSSNGKWVFTDTGWTWYSGYNWGWAPFHYGRWLYDNSYGWMWVPDTEWGPAWVTWRSGGDYLIITVGLRLNLA
jgi:hypothetical protein